MKPPSPELRARLAKILGRLGSDLDGEIAAAGRIATDIVKKAGFTSDEVLAPDDGIAEEAARIRYADNHRPQAELDRFRTATAPVQQSSNPNDPNEQCEIALLACAARECPECGVEFGGRKLDHVDGDLFEIKADPAALATWPYRKAVEWAGRDRDKLRRVARARGYRPGWEYYQMRPPQIPGRGSAA